MVAEKPSLAQSIAKILSRGRKKSVSVRSFCLFVWPVAAPKCSGVPSPTEEIGVSCLEANRVMVKVTRLCCRRSEVEKHPGQLLGGLGAAATWEWWLRTGCGSQKSWMALHILFTFMYWCLFSSRLKESGFDILCNCSVCWYIRFLESANQVASCCYEIFEALVNVL